MNTTGCTDRNFKEHISLLEETELYNELPAHREYFYLGQTSHYRRLVRILIWVEHCRKRTWIIFCARTIMTHHALYSLHRYGITLVCLQETRLRRAVWRQPFINYLGVLSLMNSLSTLTPTPYNNNHCSKASCGRKSDGLIPLHVVRQAASSDLRLICFLGGLNTHSCPTLSRFLVIPVLSPRAMWHHKCCRIN